LKIEERLGMSSYLPNVTLTSTFEKKSRGLDKVLGIAQEVFQVMSGSQES